MLEINAKPFSCSDVHLAHLRVKNTSRPRRRLVVARVSFMLARRGDPRVGHQAAKLASGHLADVRKDKRLSDTHRRKKFSKLAGAIATGDRASRLAYHAIAAIQKDTWSPRDVPARTKPLEKTCPWAQSRDLKLRFGFESRPSSELSVQHLSHPLKPESRFWSLWNTPSSWKRPASLRSTTPERLGRDLKAVGSKPHRLHTWPEPFARSCP